MRIFFNSINYLLLLLLDTIIQSFLLLLLSLSPFISLSSLLLLLLHPSPSAIISLLPPVHRNKPKPKQQNPLQTPDPRSQPRSSILISPFSLHPSPFTLLDSHNHDHESRSLVNINLHILYTYNLTSTRLDYIQCIRPYQIFLAIVEL